MSYSYSAYKEKEETSQTLENGEKTTSDTLFDSFTSISIPQLKKTTKDYGRNFLEMPLSDPKRDNREGMMVYSRYGKELGVDTKTSDIREKQPGGGRMRQGGRPVRK